MCAFHWYSYQVTFVFQQLYTTILVLPGLVLLAVN